MKFSVIIVSLNPGEKLIQTVRSALSQKDADIEIIIKDGGSKDGSLGAVRELMSDGTDTAVTAGTAPSSGDGADHAKAASVIRIIERKDTGIYDGMNQAITEASGDHLIFMNCGDYFYDDMVLARFEKAAAEYISSHGAPSDDKPLILYGSRYSSITKSVEYISPKITPLVCYRNIPCHQAMLYSKEWQIMSISFGRSSGTIPLPYMLMSLYAATRAEVIPITLSRRRGQLMNIKRSRECISRSGSFSIAGFI